MKPVSKILLDMHLRIMLYWIYKKCKILSWANVFEVVFLMILSNESSTFSSWGFIDLLKFKWEKKEYIFNFNLYVKFNLLFIYECRS